MIRSILAGLLAATLFAGVAAASCSSTIPNNLTNGNPSDANQVMANFTWITGCLGGSDVAASVDGRLGGSGVQFQNTSANNYTWLTLWPSGTATSSGFRVYNSSNATNQAAFEIYISGNTAMLDGASWGTPASTINTLIIGGGTLQQIQFPTVGTTASAANAFLDGSGTLLKSTSSVRYKRDIRPLSYEEERKVLDLTPVTFYSRAPADDPDRAFVGLTAEQVAEHLPQYVNYIKGADGKEIPDGVQYDRIAAVALLGVVKQQQKEIEQLKSAVASLMARK